MRVPDEAGEGKAKITVSFPDWKEGNVTPATIEVPIVRPGSKTDSKDADIKPANRQLLATSAQGQEPDKKGQEREPAAKEPSVRQELLAMEKEDQHVRAAVFKALGEKGISPGDNKPITDPALLKVFLEEAGKMAEVDQKNRARLKLVVDKHGWPGKTLVGKDGAHAAWLLVQHADGDVAFQKCCLQLMRAAPKGDVESQDIAYLTDRVLVAEKKKQVYGTQLQGQGGTTKAQPIEDEANVDKRRAEVGLPTLAEYLKTAQAEYDKLSGKKSETK